MKDSNIQMNYIKYFVERIQLWLKYFDIYYFEFKEPHKEIDMKNISNVMIGELNLMIL